MTNIFDTIENYIPIKNCVKEKDNGSLLIVSNDENEIIYLNETSKEIYRLCEGNNTIADIAKSILSEYDVSEEEFKQDLVDIIRDLQWKKILLLKKEQI